jgi:hypothetical protein
MAWCCKVLVLLCLAASIVFSYQHIFIQQQQQGHETSSKRHPSSFGGGQDDDLVSSKYAFSTKIRGDYSTVDNIHDIMVLAANVPIQCFDGENVNRNNNHKQGERTEDCACALLASDDSVNTRTTPVKGNLQGWQEVFERNMQLATTTTHPAPNVVFYGGTWIAERQKLSEGIVQLSVFSVEWMAYAPGV